MDVALAAGCARISQKLDSIVEDAGDVLAHVVLQMVALVDNAHVLVVVVGVVSGAVDDVRDADVLEGLRVLSDQIATKVKEVVDDL
eukprot:CAMPEP_0185572040 /NCGR_PEP_ID=MMETSP0434-20130131/4028_1 /TAXON_ID=626734 ORGANISM="Favella taraikaensis, Strain Fe Narragansett Bay" /NCGR_SAMPLE_ID=MMETSP0434 /ASSEMBLY_ACC=CAM_ASM_000379 /LENGTH=85 /DNA_ID=CAMNT_0028187741 /DNA_START=1129 /DNA_END=1386 /DNA_ORIENTATION=-